MCVVCDSSPAIDDRQDVRAVVSWGQNDASVWRLEVPLSVIVVETVQAVHAIGDIRDVIALEQQLWHHLPTVQRVTWRLCQHNGVCHTALQKQGEGNADGSSGHHDELVWRCILKIYGKTLSHCIIEILTLFILIQKHFGYIPISEDTRDQPLWPCYWLEHTALKPQLHCRDNTKANRQNQLKSYHFLTF